MIFPSGCAAIRVCAADRSSFFRPPTILRALLVACSGHPFLSNRRGSLRRQPVYNIISQLIRPRTVVVIVRPFFQLYPPVHPYIPLTRAGAEDGRISTPGSFVTRDLDRSIFVSTIIIIMMNDIKTLSCNAHRRRSNTGRRRRICGPAFGRRHCVCCSERVVFVARQIYSLRVSVARRTYRVYRAFFVRP